jgi:hypothetical protein
MIMEPNGELILLGTNRTPIRDVSLDWMVTICSASLHDYKKTNMVCRSAEAYDEQELKSRLLGGANAFAIPVAFFRLRSTRVRFPLEKVNTRFSC